MNALNYFNRNVDGIILVDKPSHLSSNSLLQKVKRIFCAKKAGHTGTLDFLATGMLPICFGEATKFSKFLLDANKKYSVTAQLGKCTDTSDAEGKIIRTRSVLINREKLEMALNRFRGKISQIPSMFSAVKQNGYPLYKLARKGITIKRKSRIVHIHSLKLIYWDLKIIKLEICCSKGTYIRTIIDDLGEILGCGAYVTELRRLKIAHYSAENMVTLESLQAAMPLNKPATIESFAKLDLMLLPIDKALIDIPTVNLPPNTARLIRFGQVVNVPLQQQSGLVRLTEGYAESFFGIGTVFASGCIKPIRLLANSNKH